MERKKKIDLHLVLKYGRPLICFVLVVSFIFIYSLSVLADGTLSDYVDFNARYGIEQGTTTANLTLYNGSMTAIYTADGYNSSNLSFTGFYNTSTQYSTVMGSYLLGSSNWATKWTRSNITYDFTNAYTMIGYNSSVTTSGATVVQVLGSGNICLIDRTIVSDAPFSIFVMFINQNNGTWGTYDASGIFSASSASANGYYCLDMYGGSSYPATLKRMGNVAFTDLNIYLPSSDGVSGFTNFSTSSTDFSFEDENFNFNYLKTSDYIISPNDPEPEPEPEPETAILGEHYNYAYVDGFIRPTSETDIAVNLSFSFNEYMRLHPNEYEIRFQWYATLTGNNLPSAYGSNYFETVNSIPLSTITGYNGWNQGGDNTRFKYSTTVNSLKNSSQKSLKDAFEEIYILGGGTANTYNGFSIIEFLKEYYTGLSSETVGKWVIRGNFTNILTKITLGCKINIVWVGGEPEQTGGKLWITYDTENGSSIVSNDLGVNFNPPEEYSPQYPAEISDSNGNVIVNSGGSNITVNPTTYSNFNAIIEYLYHIDAQEFLALAGNNQNAIQYALNTLSSTESNGFFPVLKRTFDIIPDQIWNWIKVSFAVILGGAILGISYRMVRWR